MVSLPSQRVSGACWLAETLVDCALKDRESWAFQQIADRLEGKPTQVVETIDERDNIDQFTDAELTAILRQRVKVVPVESDEQPPGMSLSIEPPAPSCSQSGSAKG
jgi:hypothetical protein